MEKTSRQICPVIFDGSRSVNDGNGNLDFENLGLKDCVIKVKQDEAIAWHGNNQQVEL